MAIKQYKPTTPSRRYMTVVKSEELSDKQPEKSLMAPLSRSGGRNAQGVTTSRFRGGGAKRMYRLVDFKRNKDGVDAKVVAIEYDPNRSANIALIQYRDGVKSYILAPLGLKAGDIVHSGAGIDIRPGNTLPIRDIPLGTQVHNIELTPGKGGQICRSAGSGAQLMAKEGKLATLRLPSGEIRLVSPECRASIGQVGNLDHSNISLGKAGRRRWMGHRPHVRGVAMTPRDHPHGGGEGRSPVGKPSPVSPWGWPTLGRKTRKRKPSDRLIQRRRGSK